ncbi:uncharacterized protein LOC132607781 [Lycium barbarum]|uniref:uncharacterized protein LOC132607781 n=1 Tax=Lycium barbarum TaxID=112863 RepID=UPI00293E4504|nr:uncharacterized protein LOC132607781 [Lycium barbarum]
MYADRKVRDLEFMVGEQVLMKISPMKGAVRYHLDGTHIVSWDSVLLDENLSYEEESIGILDRQVRKLRSNEIASVKVQQKHRHIEEATWEIESDVHARYPQLFANSGVGEKPEIWCLVFVVAAPDPL